MTQEEILKSWLDNAHAMETSIVDTLTKQVDDAAGHPEVQDRIRQHIEETKGHAQRIEQRLSAMDSKTSGAKSSLASAMGKAQGAMMGMSKYKLVQNAISDFATEHYEIATYTAIMNLARQLEDVATVQMCQEILVEERAMADWLDTHLAQVVQEEVHEKMRA